MTQNLPGLLFLIPFLAGLLVAVLGPLFREFLRHAVILVLAVFTAAALWSFHEVLEKGPIPYALSGWAPPIGIEWHLDGLSALMIVLVAGLSLLGLLNVGPEINRKLGHRVVHFYTLVLILISALTGIVLSADLFNLFVFFEVASLCAYALVAVSGGPALLSAFRYLILGTIGASFYLLGVGYLYAATGTLNMADLAVRLPDLLHSRAVISGLVFIFIGLGVKMALIPLHGWLPDAYAHAPDWVTPLLSSLNTKVALYAMVRITFWMLGPAMVWTTFPVMVYLGWVAAFATLIGAFLALSEENIKRMFAYGGLSHVGLVVVALSLGGSSGYVAGIYYLMTDALMQASLFLIAGSLFSSHGVRELADLSRVGRGMPWTFTALFVTGISMIGIPPTGGFFGKWLILMAAIENGNYVAVGVVILVSVLTLVYFVRILEKIVSGLSSPDSPATVEPIMTRLALGTATISLVLLGVFSEPTVALIGNLAIPKF